MAWYDGAWQVAAAIVAALIARWQFADFKATRRATELAQLEAAITSAATRKDPVEHAYRAHLLRRMQAVHGSRGASGTNAAIWGIASILMLLMVTTVTDAYWWVKVVVLAGMFGSFLMAARNLGQYRYSTQTLDQDTAVAYELAMVAARKEFIDATKDLPDLPPPPPTVAVDLPALQAKAVNAWKNAKATQKRDAIMFVVLIGIGVGIAMSGPDAVRDDKIEWREAVSWTAIVVTACLAVLPVLSRTLRLLLAKACTPRMAFLCYWETQLAWVVGLAMFGPDWFEKLLYRAIESDPRATLDTVFTIIGMSAATGLLLVYMAWSSRVDRWRKYRTNRHSPPPLTPA